MKILIYSCILLFCSGVFAQDIGKNKVSNGAVSKKSTASHQAFSKAESLNVQSNKLLQSTRFSISQKNEAQSVKTARTQLIGKLKNSQPNSALYYFNVFLAQGRDNSNVELLKKAARQAPLNANIAIEMTGFTARNEQFVQLKSNLIKLMNLDLLTANLTNYFKDLLNICPKNATLIFHGFDDSYNALYVQQVLGVRTDVKIINLDWLTIADYRSTLKDEGFSLPQGKTVNPEFLHNFIEMNAQKKIGISLTLPKTYLVKLPVNSNLYGTLFWCNTKIEKSISISNLGFIATKPVGSKSIAWSKNYLLYLNQQRVKYKKQNNTSKSKLYADKMKLIGKWNNLLPQINQIIAQ